MRAPALQITDHIRTLLAPLEPSILPASSTKPRKRESDSRIRLELFDDASEPSRSSLDAEGRVAELDVIVERRENDTALEAAKDMATRAEVLIMANGGHHRVGQGRVRIERVGDETSFSREQERDAAVLVAQYSCFYRVRRTDPTQLY